MKLDKRTVDALEPEGGDRVEWDEELRGFGLRIYASGRKVFVIQYRNSYGRSRRMKVGRYGPMTPKAARRKAKALLGKVEEGHDPCQERQEKRGSHSVRDLAVRFMAEHGPKRAASTRRNYEILWRPILEAMGAKAVPEVQWDDFEDLHAALGETPHTANRVLALGSKAWELATRWGWWPRTRPNPARGHDRYPEHPRGRALDRHQLAAIGDALHLESKGSISAAAFTATLLSGCRPAEMCQARWSDLDSSGRILHLKAAKTGPRAVYMGNAVAVLIARQPIQGAFIFPGRNPSRPLRDLHNLWSRIKNRVDIDDGVRLYDATRHTFVSTAARLGVPRERRKLLVGHAPSQEAHDRYLHGLDELLLRDADEVSRWLAASIGRSR